MERIPNIPTGDGFTPSQVHAITGVPPPTLSKWEREFREYLQVARTPGGHKRYAPDVVERVERLKSMILDHGMSLHGAKRQLEDPQSAHQPAELQGAIRTVAQDWAEGRTELLERLAEKVADRMLRQFAASGSAS